MEEGMKYLVTPAMKAKKFLIDELEKSADKVLKSTLFNRVSIKDKLLYLNEMAIARASLWEEVYRIYPELSGKVLSMGNHEIYVSDPPKNETK